MTRRREFSRRTKLQAFERSKGKCECGCEVKIRPGDGPEYDHRVPCEFDGGNDLKNCVVLRASCHKAKTAVDAGDMAKSRSVRARNINARVVRNPLPGGKGSKWKKRIDGTVVRR